METNYRYCEIKNQNTNWLDFQKNWDFMVESKCKCRIMQMDIRLNIYIGSCGLHAFARSFCKLDQSMKGSHVARLNNKKFHD